MSIAVPLQHGSISYQQMINKNLRRGICVDTQHDSFVQCVSPINVKRDCFIYNPKSKIDSPSPSTSSAFKWPNNITGYPTAVEVTGLWLHLFAIHVAFIH